MEFIKTGNRIAVENFEIGYFYTITMLSGNYFQACCTGIGSDFVMFSRDEPDLLFSLTMQSAADVSSIELYGGGSGTNDYNDLSNKPQLNGVTLIGNKSLSDLGIQETISDLDTIRSGAAAGATAVQPADLTTALATKQDTISDLNTIRSGAAAGATAVQPADLATALATKQDTLTSAQLAAVNSGIDSTKVAQIETNKNNISYIANNNVINILNRQAGTYTNNGVTFTTNIDGSISLSGTASGGAAVLALSATLDTTDYTYILYGDGFIEGIHMDTYEDGWANQRTFTSWVETVPNTKIWRLIVSNGTNANNVTIRPMMCRKSLFDGLYHQPAMSNAELTAAIKALQAQLTNQ